MNFSNKDRVVHLCHFDEHNEFTHEGTMTIRAHMGLPSQSTELALPEYNKESKRCYFIEGAWVVTPLFIGRAYWDKNAQPYCINTYPQELPESYSLIKPPKANEGFVIQLIDDEWQQVEDHRGQLIYNCNNCIQLEVVEKLGSIKEGFTLNEPLTLYDEWINNQWVTNQSNQHIADFNDVDEMRRGLYSRACDPLIAEANIKRLQGDEQAALEMEAQAMAARMVIQNDHPWP